MEHYDLEVCGLKRELPFVKLSDGTAYASFVVISDTELIEKLVRNWRHLPMERKLS